jgi:hypothetical protein
MSLMVRFDGAFYVTTQRKFPLVLMIRGLLRC